ncbi:MAG: YhdP family protein [Rhodoferax sp.]
MHELLPAPSLLLKAGAFVARWALRLMLTAWFLFAAVWGALHLLIVPRIGELRPQLEAAATRALGMNVRIEGISAYSTGMLPAFELLSVRLFDPQGREALRLPRVLLSLSPRSVLAMKFDQLYVDRPTLNVRRAADGKWSIAGLDPAWGAQADDRVLDRLFSQPEFVIRHGAVVWTDELRGEAPLALRDLDLVLRNQGRRHELRLDATPPPEWGDRFGLVARMEQPFLSMDNGRWREWSGQVFANFSRVDVSRLQRHADLGIDLTRGRGAVRAWVDVRRAAVTGVTADLALADVETRLGPALQPLQMAALSGRLTGRIAGDTVEFGTQGLAFDTAEGQRWPGGNVQLVHTAGNASRPAHGELTADRLDLAALGQIASRLPLGPAVHAALQRHAPSGLVQTLKARWTGPPEAIQKYNVQGRVEQLAVQALPKESAQVAAGHAVGTPGLRGATVDFDLNESSGKAAVLVQEGAVDLPGVFEEPVVPITRLSADLAWQRNGEKLAVQVPQMRFANADAEGELQLKWHTSDPERSGARSRYPGVLDMQGKLSRGTGTRVYRYLPLVLHKNVRDYVRDAVQGGSSPSVVFKVRGDLSDMPFVNPKQGEFSIVASIRDGVLAYVPRSHQSADALPWPVLTQLSGDLIFERQSLQVRGARGALQAQPAVQIPRAEMSIADLMKPATVVASGEVRGPAADLLAVFNGSPLGSLTGDALAHASANGSVEGRLRLSVPLDAPDKSTVQGSLVLGGNDIEIGPDIPRLTRARGTVAFSETGFTLNAVQGRLFGGDVRLDGGSLPVAPVAPAVARSLPTLAVRVQGTASAEGLRQARELGLVTRVAQRASGSAAYVAHLTVRASVPEIAVSSNLVGLALDLPAPLGKAADAPLPLRVESALVRESLQPGANGRVRLQDQLVLDLGRAGSVTYVRDISGAEPRVLRGAIALGLGADESAPLPPEGVLANIQLGSADTDVWARLLTEITGSSLEALDPGVPAAGPAAPARGYLPTVVALRAGELTLGGRRLHKVVLGGARDGLLWRANLDAEELNGYVEYRQPSGSGAGRVYGRLARLTLAPSSTRDVEALLDAQPSSIPALDVVVDELELRGRKLGRVEIEAVNRAVSARDGLAREWRLNRFDVTLPEAVLRASGNWAAINAQGAGGPTGSAGAEARRTVMNFRLEIANSGDLLARFGMKDVIRRGKGVMEGQVAWAGSPLTLDYPTLGGAFNVNFEGGQFLKADPGLAKLLGVLSLQSLPRRLALDFRDVFTEGFAFDFVRGDVRIERGIAQSNNLQMKGVNAAVLMDGRADLLQETQDLRVVVVPEINAGTASLIATAINPAIGLGSFLAQIFLRRPLMEAATQEFHVDGTWVDPRVSKVSRRTGVATPVPEAPAAANDGKPVENR